MKEGVPLLNAVFQEKAVPQSVVTNNILYLGDTQKKVSGTMMEHNRKADHDMLERLTGY